MPCTHPTRLIIATLLALCAGPALAQSTNHPGDVTIDGDLSVGIEPNGHLWVGDDAIIDGNLCIGNSCSNTPGGELFANDETLRFQYTQLSIQFNDTSSSTSPNNDWTLRINDPQTRATGGIDRFSIQDDTAGTTPFTIAAGVPTNAFWLATTGDIGLGTFVPQAKLHMVDLGFEAAIRMTRTIGGLHSWKIASSDDFVITDVTDGRSPFAIDTVGFVGIGTTAPEELLHIRTTTPNTDAFALFDAAGSSSDAAFLLRQNGTIPTTWEFRNQQGSGRLNVGIAGGNTPFKIDDAADNNLLRLGLNGEPGVVSVTGELRVNNTTLNVPDYVFADDYALRPLAEVQAFIDENSHLPDVPSEAEIKANGVDMTAMQMTLLKKVEELTLYTLELEEARSIAQRQNAELTAELATQAERLTMIEALLTRQNPARN